MAAYNLNERQARVCIMNIDDKRCFEFWNFSNFVLFLQPKYICQLMCTIIK